MRSCSDSSPSSSSSSSYSSSSSDSDPSSSSTLSKPPPSADCCCFIALAMPSACFSMSSQIAFPSLFPPGSTSSHVCCFPPGLCTSSLKIFFFGSYSHDRTVTYRKLSSTFWPSNSCTFICPTLSCKAFFLPFSFASNICSPTWPDRAAAMPASAITPPIPEAATDIRRCVLAARFVSFFFDFPELSSSSSSS